MSKKYNKKINCILRNMIIVFIILFFNFNVYATSIGTKDSDSPETPEIEAESEQNEKGTTIPGEETEDEKKAKEIDKKAAIGLKQIEDQDSGITMEDIEEKNYTIEDIVYNRAPIFDVNVFSDTSGGETIPDGSIERILKKAVAIWYVSFRNVTFVILAVLIIYYGIRIAISTVAEEKANYKMKLVGWIKGLVVTVFIHYIIYIVLALNDTIVNTIANNTGLEKSIYNTIKTRASDFRLSVGIPATIIYLVLLVMWLRFLWTYTKRKLNVLLLIILAPLVIAKYTYELSYGKKSKLLLNWFQKFSTSVFIQSIHALFYTVFVGEVLKLSSENLAGFIIGLMTLSFMLSADKIFTSIFKFNFSGVDIDDLNRPFKPKEDLTGLFVTYAVAKHTIPGIASSINRTGTVIGLGIEKTYNQIMDAVDEKNGKDNRALIKDKINKPLNKADDWMLNHIFTKKSKSNILKSGRQILVLRRMSRGQKETKRFSKRTMKLKKKENNRKLTSTYKFIKDVTLGGAELILAIPISVNYGPDVGLNTGVYATNNLLEATRLASKNDKDKKEEYRKQLDDLVTSVENVYLETNNINVEMERLNDKEKEEVKRKIKEYDKLKMDKYKIRKIVNGQSEELKNQITNAKTSDEADKAIEKIINNMESNLPDSVTKEEKKEIKTNVKTYLRESKNHDRTNNSAKNSADNRNGNRKNNEKSRNNFGYGLDEIVEEMDKAVIKFSFGEKYKNIGESIDKISSANSKEVAKKNSFGKIFDLNKFADTL